MSVPVLTLTNSAAERVRLLTAANGRDTAGLRLAVRNSGCSGMAYTVEVADHASEFDEVVRDKGATVFVDHDAAKFLAGTEVDFVDGELRSGFVFRNPNETSRCGCGESFHV